MARRAIEVSPAENIGRIRRELQGRMRSECGIRKMWLAAVCFEERGRGEGWIRM